MPGGLTVDPLLTAPGELDVDGYRLHADSPALNAGRAFGGIGSPDLYGGPVPTAGAVNPGAYAGPGVP